VPWRVMFFIPAGLGLIAAYFTYKSFPKTLSGKGVMDTRYFEAFRQPEIVRAFVYIFLISMLYHGVRQWLGVYFASERGMGQMAVSLTLTAGSLAGIFGEAFGGLWSDKHGVFRVCARQGVLSGFDAWLGIRLGHEPCGPGDPADRFG
jgi:predicted MFS family arabinose efflux permease